MERNKAPQHQVHNEGFVRVCVRRTVGLSGLLTLSLVTGIKCGSGAQRARRDTEP